MFPSPLHAVYVSWKLEPTNEMPQLTTLFDLVIDVISNFKPSQLHLPIRRVGSRSMDNLPEAQYQDEFYRSIFSVTSGNVCISPEFASATGAHVAGPIDVFIPKVKWGVEIAREGLQSEEYRSRFATRGVYGAWLASGAMTDYILLNCCTKIPRKECSGIDISFLVDSRFDYVQNLCSRMSIKRLTLCTIIWQS